MSLPGIAEGYGQHTTLAMLTEMHCNAGFLLRICSVLHNAVTESKHVNAACSR
jgi:hypothetical protein